MPYNSKKKISLHRTNVKWNREDISVIYHLPSWVGCWKITEIYKVHVVYTHTNQPLKKHAQQNMAKVFSNHIRISLGVYKS